MAYVPHRGDVVWITLDSQAGHEQGGRRPAVILTPASYNGRTGMALYSPVTTKVKGYPFEVILPPDLEVRGAILADQVKSLDWRARTAALICSLPDRVVVEVLAKLRALLAE